MSVMTLAELKTKGQFSFPETLNTYFQSLLDAAETACFAYCGIESGSVVEYFNGGKRGFALTHGPVSAITSVKVGGSTLAATSYRFESRSCKLVIKDGTAEGIDNVEVTYSCAFTESELFMQAIIMTVRALDKFSKRAGVTSLSLPEGGTEQYENNIPPASAKYCLNQYMRGYAL